MLSSEGNENGEKTTTDLIIISKKKKNFAHAAHFFVHFFSVVLHGYNVTTWKLVTRFMEERLSFVWIFVLGWVDYHIFLGIPAIWQWKWPMGTWSTPEPSPMELGYKDVRKHLCGGEDCPAHVLLLVLAESDSRKSLTFEIGPLCFWLIMVWGKRRNFPYLFGCCTSYSMSLSLRCWSFGLIFASSWRLIVHWTHVLWHIQNFFCFFVLISTVLAKYFWLLFWLNKYTTNEKFQSIKKASFHFLCPCKQLPHCQLLANIVGKNNGH